MRTDLPEVADRLAELDLEEEEARVYVCLTMHGPAKAREVAEATGLERSKTYRLLSSLEERGFAAASLERPTRYSARSPDEVLGAMVDGQRERLERFQRAQKSLVPLLRDLGEESREGPAGTPELEVLHGRDPIYRRLNKLVERATDSLQVLSTHPAGLRLAEDAGVMDTALDRGRQGLPIQAVFRDVQAIRRPAAEMPTMPSVEVRVLGTEDVMRFVVKDQRELLIWAVNDPSTRLRATEEVAIWTDAPGLAATHLTLFDTIWTRAKPL